MSEEIIKNDLFKKSFLPLFIFFVTCSIPPTIAELEPVNPKQFQHGDKIGKKFTTCKGAFTCPISKCVFALRFRCAFLLFAAHKLALASKIHLVVKKLMYSRNFGNIPACQIFEFVESIGTTLRLFSPLALPVRGYQ